MKKNITVGVDIGGTNIKLGLINAAGKVIARDRLATEDYPSKTRLIAALADEVRDLLKANNIADGRVAGIGIGLPGLVDPQKGVIHYLPNIPGWKNVPLKKMLNRRLKLPIFLENDVNMIALGEWTYGAGRGAENMICLTLGTGVGSGLILDGRLYRGPGFVAGELGHVPLNEKGPACPCGGEGCFERYVGNKAILKEAQKVFGAKRITKIPDMYPLAKKGDRRAMKVWRDIATHIGNGLVGVINLLNPELIVIGGGVSNNYPFFIPTVQDIIQKRCMSTQAKMVRFRRAKLGDDAGLIGAKVLVEGA